MPVHIKKKTSYSSSDHLVVFCTSEQEQTALFSAKERDYIRSCAKNEKSLAEINQYDRRVFVVLKDLLFGRKSEKRAEYEIIEALRKVGCQIAKNLNDNKIAEVVIVDTIGEKTAPLAIAEGMSLGSYQFLHYLSNGGKKKNTLQTIHIVSNGVTSENARQLSAIAEATCVARDLVNEPVSFLTSVQLSEELQKLGKETGIKVEVMNKAKIEKLKMGGILAVNKGSIDPPTFTVLEWKPKNAQNKKPFVLVGKGIVYDTGGLSLKPTPGSMDAMKCDMSGAAAVAGTMYALAKNKSPVHVVGLVPSTDNRPGGNAYTPGDVITISDGTTIEVLNTDAEGRLILADALHYAKRYNPQLVIDLATLTGACVAALGVAVSGLMGTADEAVKRELKESGLSVYERLAELPFWDDYAELIKSDIADMKNIGGKYAGAITAGKFLEKFTKDKDGNHAYPWIHLDIAGTAFLDNADSYRGKSGTGVGVRLLVDFLTKKNKITQ